MAVDRIGDDRTAPLGPERSGGRPEAAFLSREEWRHSRQGKKVGDGRCGRTIEAQPVSDQTCHIEDAGAAPGLTKPEGSRKWRAVIVSTFFAAGGNLVGFTGCSYDFGVPVVADRSPCLRYHSSALPVGGLSSYASWRTLPSTARNPPLPHAKGHRFHAPRTSAAMAASCRRVHLGCSRRADDCCPARQRRRGAPQSSGCRANHHGLE